MSKTKLTLIPIYFVLGIAILYSTSKTSKHKTEQLEFKASFDKWMHFNDADFASVKTIFTNNSVDTFEFVEMSCGYPDDYSTDSKKFKIFSGTCLRNNAVLKKIPPHQSFEQELTLTDSGSTGKKEDSFFRISANLFPVAAIVKSIKKTRGRAIWFDIMGNDHVKYIVIDSINKTTVDVDTIIKPIRLCSNQIKLLPKGHRQ